MSIISMLVLGIMALAVGILSVGFVWLISRSISQGADVRVELAQRVESLRMSKMLKKFGLDFDHYLHQVPLSQIKKSMNNCENCTTTQQCDEALKQEVVDPQAIEFCPNHECLGRFSELNQKAT